MCRETWTLFRSNLILTGHGGRLSCPMVAVELFFTREMLFNFLFSFLNRNVVNFGKIPQLGQSEFYFF